MLHQNRSRRAVLQLLGSPPGRFAWFFSSTLPAEDWSRFRGENGTGVAIDGANLPTNWSPSENLAWKAKLPGPGSSSPIVVGDKIFVTCWSGYGTEEGKGSQESLKRHLVCVDRGSGKIVWDESVPAALPEDEYGGMFAEHGYASHTPVSDGENVYAFFGKSGVYAYSLDGKQLWKADVGSGLDPRAWGSACSPILYKDKVIVLAAAESATLFAFDKKTGKVAWQEKADNFTGLGELRFSSRARLVPKLWSASLLKFGDSTRIPEIQVVLHRERFGLILFKRRIQRRYGHRDRRSVRRLDRRTSWRQRRCNEQPGCLERERSQPNWDAVIMDGKIYFFAGRVMTCLEADTGKELYQGRLPAAPGAEGAAGGGGGRGAGGGGGRRGGGGMGGQDYGSPVAGDGKIFFVTRNGDMHVIKAGDKFEHLAVNRVTSEPEDFSSTPAIAGTQLLVRSSKYLYCIEGK